MAIATHSLDHPIPGFKPRHGFPAHCKCSLTSAGPQAAGRSPPSSPDLALRALHSESRGALPPLPPTREALWQLGPLRSLSLEFRDASFPPTGLGHLLPGTPALNSARSSVSFTAPTATVTPWLCAALASSPCRCTQTQERGGSHRFTRMAWTTTRHVVRLRNYFQNEWERGGVTTQVLCAQIEPFLKKQLKNLLSE